MGVEKNVIAASNPKKQAAINGKNKEEKDVENNEHVRHKRPNNKVTRCILVHNANSGDEQDKKWIDKQLDQQIVTERATKNRGNWRGKSLADVEIKQQDRK